MRVLRLFPFSPMLCRAGLVVLPVVHHIPGSDCGSQENTLDTLAGFGNSYAIILLTIGYMFNIAIFNYLSNLVSKLLSAIHRQLVR